MTTRVPPLRTLLLPASMALLATAASALEPVIDEGIVENTHEALGIDDDFGRWNETIRLVYDPDGAPAEYSDNARVMDLVEEAFGYWTLVSGVRYEMTGVDASAQDSRAINNANLWDGLVRISWASLDGIAGQAGPMWSTGSFSSDLGYFVYEDGTIELDKDPQSIPSEAELVHVLVHEIGHLLGLGHSDNPNSVMYANPYNFLRYPRPDDIHAIQVMYGASLNAMDPDEPVDAWLFDPPPLAGAASTQFLFKSNGHPESGNGAYFGLLDTDITPVSSVTGAIADDEFLYFFAGIGGGSNAVNVDATYYVVDPSGYVYKEMPWELTCDANTSCVGYVYVASASTMKTLPGAWTLYVVNNTTNETLVSAELPVNVTTSFNQPPAFSLTATPGNLPTQATFTLTATDPEGDDIEVIWRALGLSMGAELHNTFASGGSATRALDFFLSGTHTFFVEVRDDSERYGDSPGGSEAGGGFQALLKVTVTLPTAALTVVSTADTGITSSAPTQQVLAAVAATTAPLLATNTGGGVNTISNAAVTFTYGASSDQGATTKTTFSAGDDVIIAGGVSPLAADVGKSADVYVVIRSIVNGAETWKYRNSSGLYFDWSGIVADLQPVATVTLKSSEAFEIFSGKLQAAEHRIYIGYKLTGSNTLYYTAGAHVLKVSN